MARSYLAALKDGPTPWTRGVTKRNRDRKDLCDIFFWSLTSLKGLESEDTEKEKREKKKKKMKEKRRDQKSGGTLKRVVGTGTC